MRLIKDNKGVILITFNLRYGFVLSVKKVAVGSGRSQWPYECLGWSESNPGCCLGAMKTVHDKLCSISSS